MILQNLSEESIELKEKDTQGVTFWESLIQLLQPVMHEKPYMYESFSIGCLHQVSRETYGVTIKQLSKENAKYYKGKKKIPMSNISYEYDDTSIQVEKNMAIVVLQKGQQIPKKEFLRSLNLKFKSGEEDHDNDRFHLDLGNNKLFSLNLTLISPPSLD